VEVADSVMVADGAFVTVYSIDAVAVRPSESSR
jgi:hypothetical protein